MVEKETPKPKRKPTAAQQMQHPNSLLAQTARNPAMREAYRAWRKEFEERASALERAHRRGW